MEYKNLQEKELINLCQERKIRFIPSMTEKEMIEILQMNDKDHSLIHPSVEERIYFNKNRSRFAKSFSEKLNSRKYGYDRKKAKAFLLEKKIYEEFNI